MSEINADNHPLAESAVHGVIVAPVRSGGTFLAHCLSNHPHVFCDRGEPLRVLSNWRPYAQLDPARLLDVLTNQTGYRASLCKLTYDQAFREDIWTWVQERIPRVIWLVRENLLRQAISQAINRKVRLHSLQRAQHSFEPVPIEPVRVLPQTLMRYIAHFGRQNYAARTRLATLPRVLRVTYEEITANPEGADQATGLAESAGVEICQFLGVAYVPMPTSLVRIHPGPLSALLSNWEEVRDALLQSRYADLARGERWTS